MKRRVFMTMAVSAVPALLAFPLAASAAGGHKGAGHRSPSDVRDESKQAVDPAQKKAGETEDLEKRSKARAAKKEEREKKEKEQEQKKE